MPLRSDRLADLRKSQGIKQADLAEKLDVNQNQVSRYEHGVINPSIDTLALIAQALNTTTDYLMGLSNIPHPGAEPDTNPDLTHIEREMLDTLRQHDERTQKDLLNMVRFVAKTFINDEER